MSMYLSIAPGVSAFVHSALLFINHPHDDINLDRGSGRALEASKNEYRESIHTKVMQRFEYSGLKGDDEGIPYNSFIFVNSISHDFEAC